MNSSSTRGRHRAPGRHHPLNELRSIARESAQPALKGVVVIVAASGLVATFATSANADPLTVVDSGSALLVSAPVAASGPTIASGPTAGVALSSLGIAPSADAKGSKTKAPKIKALVIEDLVVKAQRAEAARVVAAQARAAATAAAEAQRAAAAKVAAEAAASQQQRSQTAARTTTSTTNTTKRAQSTPQRASRSNARPALSTRSTRSTPKPRSNSYTPSAPSAPSASSGTRGSRNWATAGQCTWGALSQWYNSEGYYPAGWTGNALAWGYGARSAGYTVSNTPRTRSILVMQPGVHGSSSYAGHVAWVTGVSGNKVTIIEMNALAGAFNYNTRTLENGGGMQYVYAP